jgi:hypothetical protein
MMESQRKPGTTVAYEPVAYERSIELVPSRLKAGIDTYRVCIREDGTKTYFGNFANIEQARAIFDLFRPDVWEGWDASPWSVFCHLDARGDHCAQLI